MPRKGEAMILKTKLKAHQERAVEKLKNLKIGALYMEMGTGKTRTAIELIARRFNKSKIDKVLWLCPCSVKPTIKEEVLKHVSGDVSQFIIAGIESLSSSVRLNAWLLRIVQKYNVFMVVDESIMIKNHRALRSKNIILLGQYAKYKLILNGTPISKCEKDLYAQWYFLDWRILGYKSFWTFAANHLVYDEKIPGRIIDTLNVDYLVKKISPYTYQVKKEECLDLPPKTYGKWTVPMTEEQCAEYEYTKNEFLMQLDELEPTTIYRLFRALQHVVSGKKVVSQVDQKMRTEPLFLNPMDNPRMQVLFDIVGRTDEKIIIWCNSNYEIETISAELKRLYGENSTVEFYGKVKEKQRKENEAKFKSPDGARFFVANPRCGRFGLNLQCSSYVIYYSNSWDYENRKQSEDRVHRMGQEENVHIIDLCTWNTIDERILKSLARKESLANQFQYAIRRMTQQTDIRRWLDGKEIS